MLGLLNIQRSSSQKQVKSTQSKSMNRNLKKRKKQFIANCRKQTCKVSLGKLKNF